MNWRGATRKTLLTVGRPAMPAIGPIPAIGAAPVAVPSSEEAAARSMSDIQCGSSTALATGVADAQDCGTDRPPIGAERPTLARTGPRTTSRTNEVPPTAEVAALVAAPGSEPAAWRLDRKIALPKLPADVTVRLIALAKLVGPVRVLMVLKLLSVAAIGSVEAESLDELAVDNACNCCGTVDISCDRAD